MLSSKNSRKLRNVIYGSFHTTLYPEISDVFPQEVDRPLQVPLSQAFDARMGGSPLPIVINSGSGNQGITVTVPVAEYAKELGAGEEKLYRALAISNLISIHIKKNIGELSAFCGAVSAACGSGTAITYLSGGDYESICDTITGTLANVGGIICDGAKASCAAKIAASVDAAILSHEMTKCGRSFRLGDGIVRCEGMRETDIHIMRLMIEC